jgi:hypothetical protein
MLNGGKPNIGGGFKVFSFSQELLSNEKSPSDLPFIENMIKKELPYDKRYGDFIDDAFIYSVPDYGMPFIMSFSVRIFVKGVSDRPGNFINHAFVGELGGYPCNYIGSSSFNAKESGEEHYYQFKGSETPDFLPPVQNIESNDKFTYESVRAFIRENADRSRILKSAVWHILKQFELEPEKRKFIVIKGTELEIEMWIAAISYAFSPDIAQNISFATRLNRPVLDNKYNINNELKFSANPTTLVRYRAMLIGVDTRDAINQREIRAVANAPYVVLESIQANEHELSHPYFTLISRFDANHKAFCINFLRCQNELSVKFITNAYSAFSQLSADPSTIRLDKIVNTIKFVKINKITNIPNLETIKKLAINELLRNDDLFDLVKLLAVIDKNKGIVDVEFLSEVNNYIVNEFVEIVNFLGSRISNRNNRGGLNIVWDPENLWAQAKEIFAGTEIFTVFCDNIVNKCSKIRLDFYNINPRDFLKQGDSDSKIQIFFNVYAEAMCVNGIGFENEDVLSFVGTALANLLKAESGAYQQYVVAILKAFDKHNKKSIEYFRKRKDWGTNLHDCVVRNFCGEIIPVNSLESLVKICQNKRNNEGISKKEVEYILVGYYKTREFSQSDLLLKVLKAIFNIELIIEGKNHVLPYDFGFNFYESLIEQSDIKKYIAIIDDFASVKTNVAVDTQRSLLVHIDDKLNRYVMSEHSGKPVHVQVAAKILGSNIRYDFFPNACLIMFLALISNKQISPKMVKPFIGYLDIENANIVINTVLSVDDFSTEQHFQIIAAFSSENTTNEFTKFVNMYLDKTISLNHIELFADFTKQIFFICEQKKEIINKILEDIYGSDSSLDVGDKNISANITSNAIINGLKKIYEQKFSDNPKYMFKIYKIIGNKNEELIDFYQKMYKVSFNINDTRREQSSSNPVRHTGNTKPPKPIIDDIKPNEKRYVSRQNYSDTQIVPEKQSRLPKPTPEQKKSKEQPKKTSFFGKIVDGFKNASGNNDDD